MEGQKITYGGNFSKIVLPNINRELVEKYSKLADFALIYIKEAHPLDGWSIKENLFEIRQHKNLEERKKAAQTLIETEPQNCPVLIDDINDDVNKAYAALPERLYILLDNIIVFQGGRGPFDYKISEVEDWLAKYENSLN